MNLFLILTFSIQFSLHTAKIVRHTFDIRYISGSYDGVFKEKVLTVNRQFPGPTIRASVGDRLEINVVNSIQDGQNTTIHWHGIHQKGTPDMDGPAMIAQCPLKAGASMKYSFKVEEPGTYWYHGHIKSQYTEGLWGILIVENDEEVHSYNGEFSIALSDWFHQTAEENEHWYLSPNSGGIPPYPDSIMINGRGKYPCNVAATLNRHCNLLVQRPWMFNLNSLRTYRVRVINTSSRASFNFSIDGHTLQPIEVDGVDIDPTQSLKAVAEKAEVAPGQRYSFIIRRKRGGRRFSIRADLLPLFIDSPSTNINPRADATLTQVTATIVYNRRGFFARANNQSGDINDLVRANSVIEVVEGEVEEEGSNIADVSSLLSPMAVNAAVIETFGEPSIENMDRRISRMLDESLLSPYDGQQAPATFNVEFVLNTDFIVTPDGIRRPVFNNRPFRLPTDKPILYKVKDGDQLSSDLNVLTIPHYGSFVQIVINNVLGEHPFHLHGHTFWIMGRGDGSYNAKNPQHQSAISRRGPRRDTVVVGPNSWVVLRFIADNPGVWGFHCHIDWHNLAGMAVNIVEAPMAFRNIITLSEEAKRVCRL